MAKNREDKGCPMATEYLGRQSRCILLDEGHNIIDQCPFPECIEDDSDFTPTKLKRMWRNEEIRRKWKQGESIDYLAVKFGISVSTVLRAVE